MTDINLIQQLFKVGLTKQELFDNYVQIQKEDPTIFTESIVLAQIFDTIDTSGDEKIDNKEFEAFKNLDTTDNIDNKSILSDADLKIIYNKISNQILAETKSPEEIYQDAIKNGMTNEDFLRDTSFQIETLESIITLRESNSQNIIKRFEKRISVLILKSSVINNELKEEYEKNKDKINKAELEKDKYKNQIKEQENKIRQLNEKKELIKLELENLKDSDEKDKIKSKNKELKTLDNELNFENNKLNEILNKYKKIDTTNEKLCLKNIKEKIKKEDKNSKSKIEQFEEKIENEKISAKLDIETYKEQIKILTLAQEYAISQIEQEDFSEYTEDYNDLDTSNFTYDSKALKTKWSSKAPWLSDEFFNKASAVAQRIGVDQDVLLGIMSSESSLEPKAVNKNSGATGLIQFMPSTAKSLGTTTQALKNMSAEEQLVYVEKYFENVKKAAGFKKNEKIGAGTAYTLVFLPAYANRDILTKKGHKYYNANAGLDRNQDGLITKSELGQRVTRYIPK